MNYSRLSILNELLARRKAQESLESFIEYLDIGIVPAKHHKLIIRELEAVERGDTQNLMLMLPPGSAKSTYASALFPPWYIGRNPKNSIITASHTLELAERFGRKVRNIVGGQEFRNVFDFGLAADSTAAGRWDTSRGGEYFAAGVGGSITGRRADLGIIDDPVKSREDADSEVKRESAWQWYVNDFLTRLKPGAKQILIMTRWHEDDLAGRILEREASKWRIVKVCMEAGEDDPIGRKPGEILWPEWFTEDMIDRAKQDLRSWFALYQQEPRPVGGGEFKRENVMFYSKTPEEIKDSTNRYMLVDAASEKRESSDYTAIWIVGLGQDQNIYVLDCVRDKLDLAQRGKEVIRLHRKWKPTEVRYEKYGMMADIDYLKILQEQQNYRFDVVEVAGQTKKNDRIRRLVPYFAQKRIWFPQSIYRTQYDGVSREMVNEFIEQELLAFPVGKHDDLLDSLARIAEPDLELIWPEQQEEEKGYGRQRSYRQESAWAA